MTFTILLLDSGVCFFSLKKKELDLKRNQKLNLKKIIREHEQCLRLFPEKKTKNSPRPIQASSYRPSTHIEPFDYFQAGKPPSYRDVILNPHSYPHSNESLAASCSSTITVFTSDLPSPSPSPSKPSIRSTTKAYSPNSNLGCEMIYIHPLISCFFLFQSLQINSNHFEWINTS